MKVRKLQEQMTTRNNPALKLLVIIIGCLVSQQQQFVNSFRLSFGHRLFKSIQNQTPQQQQQQINPQLKPADTLIRPIECRNANNHSETGICMFSIDCMQNKGVPLSICKHNYFVGTCCKLPDYNNFVGIVYDLRETESQGALLEARRGTSSSGSAAAAGLHHVQRTPSSTTVSAPPPPPTQESSDNSTTVGTTEASSSSSSSSSIAAELSDNFQLLSSSSSSPTALPLVSQSSASTLDADKYVISSTKLFSQSTAPADSIKFTPSSFESARNADGQQQQQQQQQQLILNETSVAASYDLIATNKTQQQTDIEAAPSAATQLVVSSAHSAPSRLAAMHQNNVYVLASPSGEELSNNTPGNELSAVSSVVFSSAHQPIESSRAPPPPPVVSSLPPLTTTSDQEFTLSTSAVPAHESPSSMPPVSSTEFLTTPTQSLVSSSLAPATTTTTTSTTTTTTTAIAAANSSSQSSSEKLLNSTTVSPYVDLVSSPEVTTPFTSSLSTASLPNISSYPYAPTTTPTPATTSAGSGSTPQPLVSSSYASLSSSSLPLSQETTAAAATPTSTQDHAHSQSPPLFYSTPTTESTHSSSSSSSSLPPQAHSSRPASSGLQVASKIVTGNSGTNNLIPGLSGLQSAILAHIPFKLASGLSSGLTSYLQAAMKPQTGSHSQRPLISSNTAPALQFGVHNNTSATHKPNSGSTTSATAAAAPANPLQVRFPGATSASQPEVSQSVTQQPPRDVLKEAQLVCGRPQVNSGELAHKKRVARIVGGNQSAFGQWPWMVSLRQWRKGAFLHKCGAALLNEHWAITAAHCVENVKAPDLLLRLGEFDVSNQNEPYPFIERRVKSVVSHPSFDPKTFEYDLALIRFTEPIQYERNILPVCVPQGNDSYVDRMATVIGWGRLFEDGPLPDVIQHVDVPIITNQECEKMYKNAGFVEEIPEMFICAGISKGGRDSCEGDSGGPLTMVDHDGRSYLVGIISWGIGCALPSQPGVYTRITAFSPWINQIIST